MKLDLNTVLALVALIVAGMAAYFSLQNRVNLLESRVCYVIGYTWTLPEGAKP